jgi:hypothetical protein
MSRRATQTTLAFPGRRGRRRGAGRKPAGGRRCVAHAVRPAHVPRHPVHVTLRAVAGLVAFRDPRLRARRARGGGVQANLPARALLGPVEPRAPAGRGREPDGPHPRRTGPRDPPCPRGQPDARAHGRRLVRSLPCTRPPHAGRDASRARLRAAERAQARILASGRRRSMLVWRLVRGLGAVGDAAARAVPRRTGADAAARRRLATVRARRRAGTAAGGEARASTARVKLPVETPPLPAGPAALSSTASGSPPAPRARRRSRGRG